jgi:single-strand DNA-binding protein
MSVNKVILIGNVGKDPEIRHLEGGVTVARFPLATNETYTDKNGVKQTHTEWHNITVWRGQADIVEKYVKSGKLLYIEGKLRTTSYEEKETGVKKFFTEVQCLNFRFLGPSGASEGASFKEGGQSAPTAAISSEPEPHIPDPNDELPF